MAEQLDGGIVSYKDKISLRQEVYKKVIRGKEDLWDKYCRLCKELVRQKKLTMWKKVVEKVNVDFEGSRKEFWAFVVGEQRLRTEVLLP